MQSYITVNWPIVLTALQEEPDLGQSEASDAKQMSGAAPPVCSAEPMDLEDVKEDPYGGHDIPSNSGSLKAPADDKLQEIQAVANSHQRLNTADTEAQAPNL